jgi:hypothetical protein
MATFYFTKLALPSKEKSFHPEIVCHVCGLNSIPRPELATAATRYTCRACCASLRQSRDPETADALAAISAAIDARYWRETASVGHLDVTSG